MSTITISPDGILNVVAPGQPNETHVLQAPLGAKWTLLADGTTGDLTVTDGSSSLVDTWKLVDSNGTPWKVEVNDSGVLLITGFDKNILLAPAVNSPILLDGVPAMGYQLFIYQANTSIPANVYRNQNFISEQPFPIILNEFGLPTDPVFLISGVPYDCVLVRPDGGPAVKVWSHVLTGPPSDLDTITQWSTQIVAASYRDPQTFALVGDARLIFRVGRRVQLMQLTVLTGILTSSRYDGTNTILTVALDSGVLDPTLVQATVGLLSPQFGSIPGRRHIGTTTYFAGGLTVPFAYGLNILTPGTMGLCQKPVPAGWLECNGQAVSRTTYAALFASIATTFGAGNGTTTFNVPTVAATGLGANAATTNAITAGTFVYCIYAQG